MKYSFECEEIKQCGECPCFNDDEWFCKVSQEYIESCYMPRPSWCPLTKESEEKIE